MRGSATVSPSASTATAPSSSQVRRERRKAARGLGRGRRGAVLGEGSSSAAGAGPKVQSRSGVDIGSSYTPLPSRYTSLNNSGGPMDPITFYIVDVFAEAR